MWCVDYISRLIPEGSAEEAKCIAKLSLPIVAASCLSVTMNVVDVCIVTYTMDV